MSENGKGEDAARLPKPNQGPNHHVGDQHRGGAEKANQRIAFALFGDGASSEGEVAESLTEASQCDPLYDLQVSKTAR